MGAPKNPPKKGQGNRYLWIAAHIRHEGTECLPWPFQAKLRGRGLLGYNGEKWYAHRLMCFLVHGSPPDVNMEAAHSCGNGHLGCVNPNHLSWKTRTDNRRDSIEHGTSVRTRSKELTPEQAEEIRNLKGVETGYAVAERYGVSYTTVYLIWKGQIHQPGRVRKNPRWTPEQDEQLRQLTARGASNDETATTIGRSKAHLHARRRKLGIRLVKS